MSSRAKERKAGQEGGGKLKKATNQPDFFPLAKKVMKNIHRFTQWPSRVPDRPCAPAVVSLRTDNIGDWRDVLDELPVRIHNWMPRLAGEGVVGADAIFAWEKRSG